MEKDKVTIGFPILGILGLIFITLKLTGHIAWSWLWVLSPFWIPAAIVFTGIALVTVIYTITRTH